MQTPHPPSVPRLLSGAGLFLVAGLLAVAGLRPAGPALAQQPLPSTIAKPAFLKKGKPGASPEKSALAPHTDPEIYVQRAGKGPPVVFLHGLGGDSSVWVDQLIRLEASHTVLLFDLPGHGQSRRPPSLDIVDIARTVAKTIRKEGVAPAVLVGHSLGGTLAGYVALADPGAVSGLFMVDSMLSPYPIGADVRQRLRVDLVRDPVGTRRRFLGPLARSHAQLDKVMATAVRTPSDVFSGYLDQVSTREELADGAADLKVPVHAIVTPLLSEGSTDDKMIQAAIAQAGFNEVKQFSYDVFKTSKHWPMWDEPAEFSRALDRFLKVVAALRPPPRPAESQSAGRQLAKVPAKAPRP